MANGRPLLARWDMACQNMEVRAADRRVLDLDDSVGWVLDLRLWLVFELDGIETAVNEGLHDCNLCS